MSFPNLPAEYEDPWYTKFINWATSVQNRITGTETVANAAATKSYADGIKATADAALPSASFDTRLGTRVKVDNTVGRTAHVWDSTNSRWQLVGGDTGVRDISSLIINGWTGTVFVQREKHDLVFTVEGLTPPTPFVAGTFLANITGFTPAEYLGKPSRATLETLTSPAVSWRVSFTSGAFTVAGASSSLAPLSGVLRFKTVQAWPTTLPGTAVGSIPNA